LQSARELTVCPKCAQPLRPPVFERRQAKRRGFPTKKAAQVEFDRLKVSVHDATFVATQATTVGEYLLVWVESQAAAGLKPGTVSSYRDQIRLHVLPHLGPKPLQKLGPLDLDKLYAHLLVAGRKNGPGGLSNRTVRYIHTIVGSALKDAVAKGLVIRNVAKLASPPSVKSTRPEEVETWTHQELALFLGATADHDLATLFRTAAMTGLRRGELLGLRWSDLDLSSKWWPSMGAARSPRSRRTPVAAPSLSTSEQWPSFARTVPAKPAIAWPSAPVTTSTWSSPTSTADGSNRSSCRPGSRWRSQPSTDSSGFGGTI